MALVAWDAFTVKTMPHLPDCPWTSIREALAESSAEFFGKTRVWNQGVALQTTATLADYKPALIGVLEAVWSVDINGRTIAATRQALEPATQAIGAPQRYALVNESMLRFYPTPDGAYSVVATVALKTSLTAEGIEDYLFESYAAPIAYGAIFRMAQMPQKAWSSPDLAAFAKGQFDDAVNKALGRDQRKAPVRARPRFC